MSTFFAQGLVISNGTSMYMVWLQRYCWYRKYRLMNNELKKYKNNYPPQNNNNKFNKVLNHGYCCKTGKLHTEC